MLIPSYFPWYIPLLMVLKQSDIEDIDKDDHGKVTGIADYASSMFIKSGFMILQIPM